MSHILRRGLLRGLLLLLVLGSAPAEAVPPLDQVLGSAGFDSGEIQQIRAGQLVKGFMEGTSDRELAIKMAFLVKAPPVHLRDMFLASRDYEYDPSVTAFASIRDEGSLRTFGRLRLEPSSDWTTKAYISAKAGSALNLSTREIAAFKALKKGDGTAQERVEAQLREMLLARYRSYRQKGLAGIPPYARSGKDFEPGKGLRRKTEESTQLARDVPSFHRVLLEYPSARPKGFEEQFFWVNFRLDDTPTISLVHRMDLLEGDVYVFSERHFYVSRSHNSVQTVGGAFPVKEGTVVVYVNRTSTDQVTGFGGSTKRAIGQRVMASQIAEIFDRLRAGEAARN